MTQQGARKVPLSSVSACSPFHLSEPRRELLSDCVGVTKSAGGGGCRLLVCWVTCIIVIVSPMLCGDRQAGSAQHGRPADLPTTVHVCALTPGEVPAPPPGSVPAKQHTQLRGCRAARTGPAPVQLTPGCVQHCRCLSHDCLAQRRDRPLPGAVLPLSMPGAGRTVPQPPGTAVADGATTAPPLESVSPAHPASAALPRGGSGGGWAGLPPMGELRLLAVAWLRGASVPALARHTLVWGGAPKDPPGRAQTRAEVMPALPGSVCYELAVRWGWGEWWPLCILCPRRQMPRPCHWLRRRLHIRGR